jgi:hypothetical protein
MIIVVYSIYLKKEKEKKNEDFLLLFLSPVLGL